MKVEELQLHLQTCINQGSKQEALLKKMVGEDDDEDGSPMRGGRGAKKQNEKQIQQMIKQIEDIRHDQIP